MSPLITAISVLFVILLAGYAWFLVFRPHMLTGKVRASLERRNLTDNLIAHYFIFRSWYPTLLRCVGLFIWLWAAAFILVTASALWKSN